MDSAGASSLDKCFAEAELNGLRLRNRLIKAATFEGKTPGGVPTEALARLHERIGEGGVGMTTLAYCASEPDGRISADMMYMHEGIRGPLEDLVRRVQATGAKVAGQLGHCGNFSKNRDLRARRPLGPSRGINTLGLAYGLPFAGKLTKPQIRDRVAQMGEAAGFMKSAGFDAIEIHFGHGYGISQFISPLTNKRDDEYGGSLRNRMRFALEVLESVRGAVGGDFALLGKISMTDGRRGGISYDDSVEIAGYLEKGGIDAIVCSGGTSSMNPMLIFRGDSMLPGLVKHEPSRLMRTAMKFGAANKMFKEYPYEETYFFDQARRVRDAIDCSVCYIGGVCTSESIAAVMDAGFDFIELGRALLFDPDMPKRAGANAAYVNGCTHCNECATLIDAPGGIECVLRPNNFAAGPARI